MLNCFPSGMSPDKLVYDTSKTTKLLIYVSCCEIWPCNLLKERSNLSIIFIYEKFSGITFDNSDFHVIDPTLKP